MDSIQNQRCAALLSKFTSVASTFYPEYDEKIRFPWKIPTFNAIGLFDQIRFVHFYFIFLPYLRFVHFGWISVQILYALQLLACLLLSFHFDDCILIPISSMQSITNIYWSFFFMDWLVLYISIPNTVLRSNLSRTLMHSRFSKIHNVFEQLIEKFGTWIDWIQSNMQFFM